MADLGFRLPASLQRLLEELRATDAKLGQRLHALPTTVDGNGTVTVIGAGAAGTTVTHGLGVVPTALGAIAEDLGDSTKLLLVGWRMVTATQITFTFRRPFGATSTDTHHFYWWARA